jgi:hypothetical protein
MHRVRLIPAAATVMLLAACGDDDGGLTAPTTGSIRVSVTTTGAPTDPNGYTVSVDGGAGQSLAEGSTVTVADVDGGQHTVTLGDLADNCSTAVGANPQTVTVTAGETAEVVFAVICAPPHPGVTTLPATEVTATSVVLNGTVTPNGSATTWIFEVGSTAALGEQCIGDQTPLTGTTEVAVACSITGRPPGRTIYYRVVAANEGGGAEGQILSVTTTAGSGPAITSVTFPARVSNNPGTSVNIKVGFTDPDGDLVQLKYEEVADPNDAITIAPEIEDIPAEVSGKTAGTFTTVGYACNDPDGCVTGPVTVRLILQDWAGNQSEPYTFSFEIVD